MFLRRNIMKKFEGLNYYEILKIPVSSSYFEIKRAYRNALSLYDEDSPVTYALLSKEERTEILNEIENAYWTLIDEKKRIAYDRMLVDSGQIEAATTSIVKQNKSVPISPTPVILNKNQLYSRVREKMATEEIKKLSDEIFSGERLSGNDLKKLREAAGVNIQEFNYITKISGSVLNAIEEDRLEALPPDLYLRNFLKSYARILQIDPQKVVDRYFKTILLAQKKDTSDPH